MKYGKQIKGVFDGLCCCVGCVNYLVCVCVCASVYVRVREREREERSVREKSERFTEERAVARTRQAAIRRVLDGLLAFCDNLFAPFE